MKNTKTGKTFGTKQKQKPIPKVKIGLTKTPNSPTPQTSFDGSIRINKRIKDLGLASRRDADKLIEEKKVLVNGKVAKIGDKVKEIDKIDIVRNSFNYKYYAFYKPKDVVSHSPQYGEDEVKNFFENWDKDGLTVVGRLDKHSEGLMLVTNDKRTVERILDPKFGHERVYEVTVQERLSSNIVKLFAKGFEVRDRFTARPAKVEILDTYKFKITLTEGKKHQIRLMTNELHYTVSKLKRTHIMNLTLKHVEPGKFKEIQKEEVAKLLKNLGLN
jgi:23S rRNA pseudouridine2604 synthase